MFHQTQEKISKMLDSQIVAMVCCKLAVRRYLRILTIALRQSNDLSTLS
jgi:hypothetical protein